MINKTHIVLTTDVTGLKGKKALEHIKVDIDVVKQRFEDNKDEENYNAVKEYSINVEQQNGYFEIIIDMFIEYETEEEFKELEEFLVGDFVWIFSFMGENDEIETGHGINVNAHVYDSWRTNQ